MKGAVAEMVYPFQYTVGHRDKISVTVTSFLWSAAVDEFFLYVERSEQKTALAVFVLTNYY